MALARHAARKAAGLPSSNGLPYADVVVKVESPVAVVVAEGYIQGTTIKTGGFVAGPPPTTAVTPALRPAAPAPRALFTAWLSSPVGRSASDPRMPTDPVRIGADLDDRLRTAFLAGFVAGREG